MYLQKQVSLIMAEEEEEPEKDDCENGAERLTATEILKDAFDQITEEVSQYVENTNTQQHPSTSTTSSSGEHVRRRQGDVKSSQREVAENLLEKIQKSQPYVKAENFDFFDMLIIIPKFICLGWYLFLHTIYEKCHKYVSERQTVDRFQSYINQINDLENEHFLLDLQTQESSREVESRVLRNAAGEKKHKTLREWKQRISKEDRTLFYIIHDEGVFYQD